MLPPKAPENQPAFSIGTALPFSVPIQTTYVNGFLTNVSSNDVTFICTLNQAPQVAIAMTHSAAKTFATNMLSAIERLEKESGLIINDFEEVNRIIAKHKSDQGQQ